MKRVTTLFFLVIMLPCLAIAQYNPLTKPEQIDFKPKSEKTAKALTLAVPAAGILTGSLLMKAEAYDVGFLLISGGILIGPSAGNMYAENTESVIKGISTRAGGLGLIALGTYLEFFNSIFEPHSSRDSHNISFWPKALMISGAGLVIYSWGHDFYKSVENVREYNGENDRPSFTIAPTYFPKEKAPGVSISLSF
ncbi:MAG: hypothetical protein CL670_09930 [Balneola sp.]|nr:hypothetical protein [Balneola sp.]MBE79462.1 hypothetical protein [Balneola sp.]|tara:strand:+ start:6550 stop:7134 length:585 start_codon:yes stop_codon:yes gene_type:complete